MKWALFIAGGIALLIVLVVVGGSLLPKGHRASRRAVFRRTPEEVFAAITGPPDWRSDDLVNDERVRIDVVESKSPLRLVTRIAGDNLAYGGTWTQELSKRDIGTELRVTEEGEIYNPLFRFMARYVFGYTSSMETYLRDLGKKFGETTTPEA